MVMTTVPPSAVTSRTADSSQTGPIGSLTVGGVAEQQQDGAVEAELLALADLLGELEEAPQAGGDEEERHQHRRSSTGATQRRPSAAAQPHPRRVTFSARRSRCASTSARSMPSRARRASVK